MWLIPSVAAFVIGVFVHSAIMRIAAHARPVPAFMAIGGAIWIMLIVYCVRRYGLTAPAIAAVLIYSFACELYIFLFTLVGNSVSFGLLARLADAPLKPDAIARFYRTEGMIARRFSQLESNDFIVGGPAGFTLTTRGKRVVHMFSLLHRVLGRPNRWAAEIIREGDHAS
jgi:hypothetical protein